MPCWIRWRSEIKGYNYSKNPLTFWELLILPKRWNHLEIWSYLSPIVFDKQLLLDNPPCLFRIAHFNHPKMVKLLRSPVNIGTYILLTFLLWTNPTLFPAIGESYIVIVNHYDSMILNIFYSKCKPFFFKPTWLLTNWSCFVLFFICNRWRDLKKVLVDQEFFLNWSHLKPPRVPRRWRSRQRRSIFFVEMQPPSI